MLERKTLPGLYYTDSARFQAELERFFFGGWIAAGRADAIPKPGDYLLLSLGRESIVILRSEDGALRAFYNVCRHRGTRLCTEETGNFAGRIQCPYHAWTYDLEGRLVSAPHMDGVEGFSTKDYPLHPVAIEAWDGHVFVNLSAKPAALASGLGGLMEKFRPWRMAELRRGARIVYSVAANWKLIIQNYSECVHCPIIHPQLQKLSHYLSGENDAPQPGYLGGRMELRPGVETMSLTGKRERACLPGLEGPERTQVYYYAILPNLLLSLHPDYMMTHTLWPRSAESTGVVCEWHFHPEEMAKPGFDPQDAVSFWDLTNRQDWKVSELSQLGIQSRAYGPGPYSPREGLLHALDRLVLAELAPKPPLDS